MKAKEAELKEANTLVLLNEVNGTHSRLREKAKLAWEAEQPSEDITTNDGSFHKTKLKKYPKIAALQYASAKWENNRLLVIRINGEKFTMFASQYEYNKETVYTRPATFSEFLDLNSIPENEITIEQYNAMAEQLTALNEKLQKDMESYKDGLKALEIHSLSHWGLVHSSKFTIFAFMKYRYVYSLTHDGSVFYIGCTEDLSKRYMQHLADSKKGTIPVNKYIKQMLDNSIYPEVNIICYLPKNEAIIKEAQLLLLMTDIGHNLTNRQFHFVKGKNYPFSKIKYKSDLAKVINYRMKVYLFHNHNRDIDGKQISFNYPFSPDLKTYSE